MSRLAPLLATSIVAAVVVILLRSSSLEPTVREDFFFSDDDPAMAQSLQLRQRFGSPSQVSISAVSDNIASEEYLQRIEALSAEVMRQEGVLSVKSLSRGPGNFEDASESPLWKPLLITDDGRATHVIIVIDERSLQETISSLEDVVSRFEEDDFTLHLAGAPYVTERLRRDLASDFKRTSLFALATMALIVAVLFRSVAIVAGALIAGVGGVSLTLLIYAWLGLPLGILTANLTTIVIVLVISHAVFLAGNWRRTAENDEAGLTRLRKVWVRTLRASFWCMVTTLVSFAMLIGVDAEPLRQLGFGGVIGSLVALFCAFFLFPAFLLWDGRRDAMGPSIDAVDARRFWDKPMLPLAAALVVLGVASAIALPRLDTDPDLFAYFTDDGPVEQGLRYVDSNGGSNPLILSVRHEDGLRLDRKDTYEQLWELQQALQDDPVVGTIISLPLIMAEAEAHPLSFLFSFEKMLDFLQSERFERVADGFITADRSSAFFLLRMIEANHGDESRLAVVERIEGIAAEHRFNVELVGGVYYLQGELARMVRTSLIQGLAGILLSILIIAYLLTRDIRSSIGLVVTAAAVPLCIFGAMAIFGIPLDMIAAPAATVAVGMAIDMTIHLSVAARLSGRDGWSAWTAARSEQWRSIVGATVIVCGGFSVLAISGFPPTSRFGIAVVVGTVVAAAFTLWVLPLLAASHEKPWRQVAS